MYHTFSIVILLRGDFGIFTYPSLVVLRFKQTLVDLVHSLYASSSPGIRVTVHVAGFLVSSIVRQ